MMELIVLGVFWLGYVASLRAIGKDYFNRRAYEYGVCRQERMNYPRHKCEARHDPGCWQPAVRPRDRWDGLAIATRTLGWPVLMTAKAVVRLIPETATERDAWIDVHERKLKMSDDPAPVVEHAGPSTTVLAEPFWTGEAGETFEFTYEQGRPERTVWLRLLRNVHPGDHVKIGPLDTPAEVYLVRTDAEMPRRLGPPGDR